MNQDTTGNGMHVPGPSVTEPTLDQTTFVLGPSSVRNARSTYISTKTYDHNTGLSCAFRQWRAESHCRLIHGYALGVRFEFLTSTLDVRNWVVDFGSMKGLKGWLEDTFDHTLLVAQDDPEIETFRLLNSKGIARVVEVAACGCEKFAELIFDCTEIWLKDNGYAPRVQLHSVEVKEHGANSAIFKREYL